MKFNEKLIELRRAHGYSQEELGYKLNVTRQTISKWEASQTTPEMDKLMELSKVFNLSIDQLVGNSQVEEKPKDHVVYYRAFRYEYKSERTLLGLPLVHINIGRGIYQAKGIIAIGTIARGFLSIGFVSCGLFSIGGLSLGLLSLAAISLGLLSFGAISIGIVAFGGISIGLLSFGGLAIGKYAIGGAAFASDIAMGGYAKAHIAIGDVANGMYTWENIQHLTNSDFLQIKETILHEFPTIWSWILYLFV